jgi:hypothetical protein
MAAPRRTTNADLGRSSYFAASKTNLMWWQVALSNHRDGPDPLYTPGSVVGPCFNS